MLIWIINLLLIISQIFMKKRVIAIEGGEIARDEKRGMYEDEN